MRLLQKELLLYNDYYDNWEVIETKASSYNTVLSNAIEYNVNNGTNLFVIGTAGGEVLQSKDGQNYLLKQPKINGTDTPFTEGIKKIARASDEINCYLIITSNNKIYFSDDDLETVKLQTVGSGVYLDATYCYGKFWVVGENGFYVRATIVVTPYQSGYKYRLNWEQPASFTTKTIQQIKYFNDAGILIAVDFEYKNSLYYNDVYKYSLSTGWNLLQQNRTDCNIVDVACGGSTLIAIRDDDRLNLQNISNNLPLVFNIQINGSGITYCNGYYVACGTNGKIVVSDDLQNWKEFAVRNPQNQNLQFKYIASMSTAGDIVAMDSSYIAYINTNLLDKLMEL